MSDKPLQTQPIGLLGAMGLKVSGQSPGLFGDVVAPEIDVFDFYLLDRNDMNQSTVNVAIGTQSVATTIGPANSTTWRLLGISAEATLDVADVALVSNLSVGIVDQSGLTITILCAPSIQSGVQDRRVGVVIPRFVLPLGWKVYMRCDLSGAPSVAWSAVARAMYQRVDL